MVQYRSGLFHQRGSAQQRGKHVTFCGLVIRPLCQWDTKLAKNLTNKQIHTHKA